MRKLRKQWRRIQHSPDLSVGGWTRPTHHLDSSQCCNETAIGSACV